MKNHITLSFDINYVINISIALNLSRSIVPLDKVHQSPLNEYH